MTPVLRARTRRCGRRSATGSQRLLLRISGRYALQALVGHPGSSAVALRRVAGRLHLDQAVPEYGRVDAVFGESRWKLFAWMAASMAPSDLFLIGAGQARVAGL